MRAPPGSSSTPSYLGTLHVKLLLDQPQRVHYGPDDAVTGHILLKYRAAIPGLSPLTLNAELFGPLSLQVVFRGIARLHIGEESRVDTHLLFAKVEQVHDGSFRAQPDSEHVFPFTIRFPEHAQPRANTRVAATQHETSGRWVFEQSVASIDVDALPPSMESTVQRSPAGVTLTQEVAKTLASVRYTLTLQVRMTGIEVQIEVVNRGRKEIVYYDQPKVPASRAINYLTQSHAFEQQLTAQHDSLRPPEARPRGIRDKTKALLKPTEPPKYVFTVRCFHVPQHAFIGQPIEFDISIASHSSSTTTTPPAVFLDSCNIALVAYTSGMQPSNIEILRNRNVDISHPPRPFSSTYGWSRGIDVGTLSYVPSTFRCGKIARSYKLRITIVFSVGKQNLHLRRDMPLEVHPPLHRSSYDDDDDPDGSSRARGRFAETLPAYEEERAPAYEEIV